MTSKGLAQQILLRAPVVDLHIHPSMSQQIFRRDIRWRQVVTRFWDFDPVRSSFPRMFDGGYDAFLSVLYVPERGLIQDFPLLNLLRVLYPMQWQKLFTPRPFDVAMTLIDDIERAAASSTAVKVQPARTLPELEAILAQEPGKRPLAMLHAFEGAHVLEAGSGGPEAVLGRLDALFKRGVAYLTLVHFFQNGIAHPCYPYPFTIAQLSRQLRGNERGLWRDLTQGLTPLGEQVVERMIELGMLIDLSHCTPVARRRVYEIAKASRKRVPLLMTHVGAYAFNPSPYNPADWEIRQIAELGGVVGTIFMNYWLVPAETSHSLDAVAQTLDHVIEVGGEDVAGIGTDFDGFTTPPVDLCDASKMRRLIERLIAEGYSEARIAKILGGNALRALREGWGAR